MFGFGVSMEDIMFQTRSVLGMAAAVGALMILSIEIAAAAASQRNYRPITSPANCRCNCKCIANAMFTSRKHAVAWAKVYYEKCGCG